MGDSDLPDIRVDYADGFNPRKSDGFNPRKSDRLPRCLGFAAETEYIFTYLRDRGDQRLGQYLINVIRSETGLDEAGAIEGELWSIEADRLLELIERYESDSEGENSLDDSDLDVESVDDPGKLQGVLEETEGE